MTLLLACLPGFAQGADRKESPFDALRWNQGQPEVEVGGVWYQPVAIEGIEVRAILKYCEKRWPSQLEKRFGEDLVEAMQGMGAEPPRKVQLKLVRLADGEALTLEGVRMSEKNRDAIRNAGREPRKRSSGPPATLAREAALADLKQFEARLRDQFAYLNLKGIDLASAMEELGKGLGERVQSVALAERLQRLLMRFGDGHASVSSPHAERPGAYPPVLFAAAEGGVVAFHPDRSGLLNPKRPFVLAIDGQPLEAWIDGLRPWIVDGSEQAVSRRALGELRELVSWRKRLGYPASDSMSLELAPKPGAKKGKSQELKLGQRRPSFGPWPRTESRELKGKLGYLRLAQMDDDLIPELHRSMQAFRETKGLIVDVRGNGGGSRGLLIALAGYLVGPTEKPWVGNLAFYRKSPQFDDRHLEARFMYRAEHERWTPAQRAAIERSLASFEPEWDPGEGFSELHFLVLDKTGHEDEYFYGQPVVLLSDAGCFSATDIFLGALSGRPRVTLMGSASSGGSARSQGFRLSNSGIEVRCASMASFRPDGRLYDGRGIEVDIEVLPDAEDLLLGDKDRQLEAAIKHLKGR